jgi:hypothetical protein
LEGERFRKIPGIGRRESFSRKYFFDPDSDIVVRDDSDGILKL